MYISSWSGGKDSCFACYKALQAGYEVTYLVNFISKEYKRVSFHGIQPELIQLQSIALDVPLLQKGTSRAGYDHDFKEVVRSLKDEDIKGIVLGDIYSHRLKEWADTVCFDLGLKAFEPLWGKNPEDVVRDFLDAGFEAIIVSAQSRVINKEWVGCPVSVQLIDYLEWCRMSIMDTKAHPTNNPA